MKSIFLCDVPKNAERVYDTETRTVLKKIAGLDSPIYTKQDILLDPTRFADTEYIFSTWGMPILTADEIMTCLPNLKCLFYGAGTVQDFARPFLACGVRVFSAWGANAVPVAEMTVAEIVLANKGYYLSSRLYKSEGRKKAAEAFSRCAGNYGETVGIIGAGMIGKLVIRMLKAYRLNVIVFDPFLPSEEASDLGVELCSLEEVFERAFTVSNHLANNPQTRGMLCYDLFRRMRENAVFINTGRGAQVVEDDLVRILRERPDLTALLDVTYPEPPVSNHPFYTLENCLLTPHIAGSAGDEVRRMGLYMQKEFEAYRDGLPCTFEVTEAMLKTMA